MSTFTTNSNSAKEVKETFTEEELAIITRVRDLIAENGGNLDYCVPDNCPGDGEDGYITENGIHRFADRGGGEYFTWREVFDDLGCDGVNDIIDCADIYDDED